MDRKQIKSALQADGKWDEFVQVRDKLKSEGVAPPKARTRALAQVRGSSTGGDSDCTNEAVTPPGIPAEFLLDGPLPEGRGGVRESVEWVAANLALKPHLVDLEAAPNSTAVALLSWAKGNCDDFWKIWSRLLPNKKEIEKDDQNFDDGRDLHRLMDDIDLATGTVTKLTPLVPAHMSPEDGKRCRALYRSANGSKPARPCRSR